MASPSRSREGWAFRDCHLTLSPLRPHSVFLMEDAATERNIRVHRED
jgi:hypothetical protein